MRIQTTGEGSIYLKIKRSQRICDKCGSTNIIYNKMYAKCDDCGNLMPKRLKKFKTRGVKKLPFSSEVKHIKYDGRIRGIIHGDKYITQRNKVHFVRKYAGFGISEKIFDILLKKVKTIAIIYTKEDGTQEVYYSDIKTWIERGVSDKLGMYERQIFLPVKYMNKEGKHE